MARIEAWFASMKPTSLIVVRLLLVANVLLLSVIGALYAAFAARPAGLVIAGVLWGVAAALASLVRFTTPRRRNDSRW